MKKFFVFFILITLLKIRVYGQTYPVFGNDIPVSINGLTFDAMEPALSTDGNALFFNSLNDGITTSIYYAAKVNDSVFNFIGLVPIINQTVTPHLDGVASLDSSNNLYWVSTRNYPASYNNLQRIKFTGTGYTNFGSVYGDIYINAPGHLIMDATVNYNGEQLIYCNAYFNNCFGGAPCKSSMGMAQKLNDSTFNKLTNTSTLFTNINDTTNYIVYAPSISKNGLELYYTRLLHNGSQTEIMVSVRTNTNQAFGLPMLLIGSPNLLPEAATISSDNSKIYYHKKVGGVFKIFLREIIIPTHIDNERNPTQINIFPNPVSNTVFIKASSNPSDYIIEIYNVLGLCVLKSVTKESIDVSNLAKGIYYIKIQQEEDEVIVKQFIKQ